jgi:hypothetical protein
MWVFGREDPLPRGIGGASCTPGLEDWGRWARNEESVEFELLGLHGWGRLAVPEGQEELLELADSLTGGAWLSQIDRGGATSTAQVQRLRSGQGCWRSVHSQTHTELYYRTYI